MTTLARRTPRLAAALGGIAVLATCAAPAHASFLQELGSPFIVGAQPYGVVAADFNGDSRLDVMGFNGTTSSATLLLRQPGGGFKEEGSTTVYPGPNFGTVADFNRDNRPDFAVSGFNQDGGVSVMLRRATGGGFVNANGSPYGKDQEVRWASAAAAGDFNDDGLIDLAVARYYENGLTILLQQAGGNFVQEAMPATGINPRYIAVGDFNGDNRPDLAVTNAGGHSVSVLLRNAGNTGFFAEGSAIPVGQAPIAIVAKDMTGDSRPDLAVANSGSDTITLLARQPGGGFAPMAGSPISVGDQPQGVAVADFNGDGQLDLAAPSNRTNTVSVLLRQPGGGFAPDTGSPFATDLNPDQITAADFNGDGKPDLAITNNGSGRLTVLLNTTSDPVPPATVGPAPGPAPVTPAATPLPRINARLVLTWTVTKANVRVTSATLRDLPAGGATVKISCKACKVSQTLTTKKTTLSLTKLRDKKLKRRATFTVTVTKPGYNGLTFTRKVKNYGRTKAALRKAVRGPFSESRKCVPLAPAARC